MAFETGLSLSSLLRKGDKSPKAGSSVGVGGPSSRVDNRSASDQQGKPVTRDESEQQQGGKGGQSRGVFREESPSPAEKGISWKAPNTEQVATAPERIPQRLPPATRILANSVMRIDETWAQLGVRSREMRDALNVLAQVEERMPDTMPAKVKPGEESEEKDIWDYIQQCVDEVMSRGPEEWVPWLNKLSDSQQLAPIVSRVLSTYALEIYLKDPQIKKYVEQPFQNGSILNLEWFRSQSPDTFAALKSIGDFIKTNPQHGEMVKAVFNWQSSSFGGAGLGRFHYLYTACGLV